MEEAKNNLNEQGGKISYKILTPEDILEKKDSEIKEEVKDAEEIKPRAVESQIFQQLSVSDLSTENQPSKQTSQIKKYILIIIPIITLVSLAILFKPHKKILSLLISKETQKEKTTTETTSPITFPSQEKPDQILIFPTTSQIISLPISTSSNIATTNVSTITDLSKTPDFSTTTNVSTTTETTTKIIAETSTEINSATTSQSPISTDKSSKETNLNYPLPQKEFDFINLFSSREVVTLNNLNQNVFDSSLNSFLRKQEEFGTKVYVDFVHNGQKIPYNFIFDYFFKSSKVNLQELKDNFTGNYAFLVFYGYARKYPILIFEVNNHQEVKKFNQNWEKISMANDLKTLFLGLDPGKISNKFISRSYKNYSYRILDLGDNYKIIWSIVNQYLIYSTTEAGLKTIIDNL